jgi:hypothetical protein
MAEQMNVQIAAWCHFYWKSTNPGGERFYQKPSNRAFNQVMLHKISKCEWDEKSMTITLPTLQSKLSAVIKFENQDWVKNLAQANTNPPKKKLATQTRHSPFKTTSQLGPSMGPT